MMKGLFIIICAFVSITGAFAQNSLPLYTYHAKANKSPKPFLFIISGDGGWNSFTAGLAQAFAKQGYETVGLDAKTYFWEEKTPEVTAGTINQLIQNALAEYKTEQYIILGFSFGACVAPFVVSHTPEELQKKLNAVFLISPDKRGDFEIHLADMLNLGASAGKYDVLAELKKIKSIPITCLFGSQENENLINDFKESGLKTIVLPGNHHYDNKPENVVKRVLVDLKHN